MSDLSTLPKGDSAWLFRKAIERIMQQVSVLETNIGSSTTGNSANTQIIFNDDGTLRGDAGLVYNKTTDALTVAGLVTAGSATITGDLTAQNNIYVSNNVTKKIGPVGSTWGGLRFDSTNQPFLDSDIGISFRTGGATSFTTSYVIGATGISTWSVAGTTAMTLNSTGLGIGASPSRKLSVSGAAAGLDVTDTTQSTRLRIRSSSASNFFIEALNSAESAYVTLRLNDTTQIDSSGNVGVGVTPSAWAAAFKVVQFGPGSAISCNTNASRCDVSANYFYDGANKFITASGYATNLTQENGNFYFYRSTATSGGAGSAITFTQAMTLDASGNLLVGTTTQPSGVSGSKGTFKSTASDWTSVLWNSNATPFGLRIQHDTDVNGSSSQFLFCYGASTTRAEIRSNGGLANFSANNVNLSDIRTKTDIKPLTSYWNKIKALELVTFKYKDQTHNDDNIGLIAQQVESVAPELIDADGFGETPEDGVPLKTIYTTDLYHAAIKALQEAMTRIEVLEAKLA
jgi:hypothetical protein